jgi:hypothetical protein
LDPKILEQKKNNIPWARLLTGVFNIDVETCTQCGGRMKIIAPVEERKPIYQNILKFAELHPKKTRVALYAPTKGVEGPDILKATGTEGAGISKFSSGKP